MSWHKLLTSCPLKIYLRDGQLHISICQARTHKFYFIISTYLSVRLPFLTCRSNVWHQNQHKSFSLINKYQIPEILYFSNNRHEVISFCQALGSYTTLDTPCGIDHCVINSCLLCHDVLSGNLQYLFQPT